MRVSIVKKVYILADKSQSWRNTSRFHSNYTTFYRLKTHKGFIGYRTWQEVIDTWVAS